MSPEEVARTIGEHGVLLKTLQSALAGTATKDDVAHLRADVAEVRKDIRDALKPALDSAPAWAVRQIGRLQAALGVIGGAALSPAVSWVAKHFGHAG